MFENIHRGWQITKQSFAVLRADKEILLFPILSAVFMIGATIIITLLFLSGIIGVAIINNEIFTNIFLYIFMLLYFFVLYAIGIFFEGVIITSATIRFSGRNPSFTEGLAGPLKKVPKIIFWALINAIISILLNIIENVTRKKSQATSTLTSIGTSLFGIAWNLLTFFVLPIILFEKESTIGSIKRSKELFVKTWGENITAQITTGGIFFLIGGIGIIPLIFALLIGSQTAVIAMFVLFLIWIGIIILFATSINGILVAALYQYAITGKLPNIYSPEIQTSMKKKN